MGVCGQTPRYSGVLERAGLVFTEDVGICSKKESPAHQTRPKVGEQAQHLPCGHAWPHRGCVSPASGSSEAGPGTDSFCIFITGSACAQPTQRGWILKSKFCPGWHASVVSEGGEPFFCQGPLDTYNIIHGPYKIISSKISLLYLAKHLIYSTLMPWQGQAK